MRHHPQDRRITCMMHIEAELNSAAVGIEQLKKDYAEQ
jgi:hypothetical protein